MKESVDAIVKDEKIYCEEARRNVNIHSMTHPILKVDTLRFVMIGS